MPACRSGDIRQKEVSELVKDRGHVPPIYIWQPVSAESGTKGAAVDESVLAKQMDERDRRDSTRADAPLSQAPDAIYLDSTSLNIQQVEEAILKIVRARVTNGKEIS